MVACCNFDCIGCFADWGCCHVKEMVFGTEVQWQFFQFDLSFYGKADNKKAESSVERFTRSSFLDVCLLIFARYRHRRPLLGILFLLCENWWKLCFSLLGGVPVPILVVIHARCPVFVYMYPVFWLAGYMV
ncbi:hypothetical protein Dsin_020442 [Dipteronia sinensis]|uniref:Uncharacterized protein n=1 Tax=Dipteronia sinensis TaxID=43782 RepID=A0AAE0E401_9ROSI|nr:hypothetical protein Dsin_020442 [Dipteronia sinensis]